MQDLRECRGGWSRTSGAKHWMQAFAAEIDVHLGRVQDMRRAAAEPIWLDMPIGFDRQGRLGASIPDLTAVSPADAVSTRLLIEEMAVAMETLPARQRQVLTLRLACKVERR